MKATIPQTGNTKKSRNPLASMVADIEKVDASYVRKLLNGTFKPTTKAGKEKAKRIMECYRQVEKQSTLLIKNIKKERA